jgi:hypothetical protein
MKVFAFTLARHTNKKGLITIARTPHATAIIGTQMSIGGIGGTDTIIGTTTIDTTIGINELLGSARAAELSLSSTCKAKGK